MSRLENIRLREYSLCERFEALEERGEIEILEREEDAATLTYEFRRIPGPSIEGWVYLCSFSGDFACEAADIRVRKVNDWGRVRLTARSVDAGEFGIEWDVFLSQQREDESASI